MNIALPFFPKSIHRMGEYIPKSEGVTSQTITIKQPEVVDVSFYNGLIDWSKVSPLPFGVIVKVCEWGTVDAQFDSNWTQLGNLKIPRAGYCFFHFNQLFYTSARQARTFTDALQKSGIGQNEYYIIDAEERDSKGNSLLNAAQITDFLWNVQVNLGLDADNMKLLIYSTAELLNNLSFAKLQAGQAEWLKAHVRIWTAGYPNSPDSYLVPPSAYIPDPSRYGNVVLWQYNDSVPPFGDVNWIDPVFASEWSNQTIPAPVPQPVPQPSTINQIIVNALSDSAVELLSTFVDGNDETAKTTLNVKVLTPPTPPPPAPPVVNPNLPSNWPNIDNIWSLRNREELTPPLAHDGSFNAMGGHGQTCCIILQQAEMNIIRSCWKDNEDLWPGWWVASQAIHPYIGNPSVDSTGKVIKDKDGKPHYDSVKWPIIVSGSTDKDRNYVRVIGHRTRKVSGKVLDEVQIDSIPFQASGDYSAYLPDKCPWMYVWMWTDFKNGNYGDSHNGLMGYMPLFDPLSFPVNRLTTDAKILAGNWIESRFLLKQLS